MRPSEEGVVVTLAAEALTTVAPYLLTYLSWPVVTDDGGLLCFTPPLVCPQVTHEADAGSAASSTLRVRMVRSSW